MLEKKQVKHKKYNKLLKKLKDKVKVGKKKSKNFKENKWLKDKVKEEKLVENDINFKYNIKCTLILFTIHVITIIFSIIFYLIKIL